MKFDARWFKRNAASASFLAVVVGQQGQGTPAHLSVADSPAPSSPCSAPKAPPAYLDDIDNPAGTAKISPPASAMHLTTLFDPQAVLSLWIEHGTKIGGRVYKLRCRFDECGRRYIHADDLNSFARLTQLANHR